MRPQRHIRGGRPVPGRTECVEAFGDLTEGEFRHIIETLLGRPRERFKGSGHYVFAPVTAGPADAVCRYLRSRLVAYDREITARWSPAALLCREP